MSSKFSGDVNITALVAQLSTFQVLMRGVPLRCFQEILREVQDLQPVERQLIANVIVVQLASWITSILRQVQQGRGPSQQLGESRPRMLQARFNHLAILNTHKDTCDKLCLVSVANSFVSLNENRERNCGKFTTADFSRWTCCFPLPVTVHA